MARAVLSELLPVEVAGQTLAARTKTFVSKTDYDNTPYLRDLNMERNNNQNLLVVDVEMIRQQIDNVLATLPGSEQFEPTFGSLLTRRIFEMSTAGANTDAISYQLEMDVYDALTRCMSDKIIVHHSLLRVSASADNEAFLIEVAYTTLRTQKNDLYKFYVRRPR